MVTFTSFDKKIADFEKSDEMIKHALESKKSIFQPVEAPVEKVSEALKQVMSQIVTLDQERKMLGLSDDFLQSEVACLEILRVSITNHLERRVQHFKEKAKDIDIEGDDEIELLSQLKVAQEDRVDQVELSEAKVGKKQGAELPRLRKVQDLPETLASQADLVDDYNAICDQLAKIDKSYSEESTSIKEKLRVSVCEFKESFSKNIGFVEGHDYSKEFKFYRAADQMRALDSVDQSMAYQEAHEVMRTQAAHALSGIEKSGRLETVEAYIRLKTFEEYSEYIEQHYIDSKTPQERFDLKVEIAKSLQIDLYFYSKAGSSSGEWREKTIQEKVYEICFDNGNVVREVDTLIKDSSVRAALDEQVSVLIETLHTKGLIVETISKGAKSYSPKKMKYFEVDGLGFEGSDKRSRFVVQKSASSQAKINQCIFDFVLELSGDSFEAILTVDDLKGVQPFEKLGEPCFKKSKKFTDLSKALTLRDGSLQSLLKNISETSFGIGGVVGESACSDRSIIAFNTNAILLQGPESKRELQLQKVIFFANKLCLDLGLDQEGEVDEKLSKAYQALLQPKKHLAQQVLSKVKSCQLDYELALKGNLKLEQVRDFFIVIVHEELKTQYEAIKKTRADLLKKLTVAEDKKTINSCIEKLDEADKKLRSLDEKKVKLASDIYKLYSLLYDPELEGSIASEISKVRSALVEGFASTKEIKELEKTLEELKPILNLISPSVVADFEQTVTSFKTQALSRNMQLVASDQEKIKSISQKLKAVKKEYKALVPKKTKKTDRACVAVLRSRQKKVDQSLAPSLRAAVALRAQEEVLDRRIKDLSAPLGLTTDGSEKLGEPGQIVNPSLQALIDAEKKQKGISKALLSEVDRLANETDSALGSSIEGSPVSSISPSLDDDLGLEVIDRAVDALHDVEYFDLDLIAENLSTPSRAIIPSQTEGNFFARFSENKIAKFLVRAYKSAVGVLTIEYDKELRDLDSSVIQEKVELLRSEEKNLEAIKSRASGILATQSKFQSKKLSKIKIEEKISKLETFNETIPQTQSKVDRVERKIAILQRTLGNADVSLDEKSVEYAQKKLAVLEAEKNGLITAATKEASKLGVEGASQSNLMDLSVAVKKQVQVSKHEILEIDELESPAAVYAAALKEEIQPSEQKIERLKESIVELSATGHSLDLGNLDVYLRDQKTAYHDLLDQINRRAFLAAFKVFGLSCSRSVLDQLVKSCANISEGEEKA
ncbi:MAG: hypothetical protein S4CHLAM6_00920 [Chlamydiae bacterium]|nr:hypothetical protein [Chlamydiota bacterium]